MLPCNIRFDRATEDKNLAIDVFVKLLHIVQQNYDLQIMHRDFVFNRLPFLLCDTLGMYLRSENPSTESITGRGPFNTINSSIVSILVGHQEDGELTRHLKNTLDG